MKDFITTGKFDHLKLGQTKSEIASILPEPDDILTDTTPQASKIWRYGKIELHFNDDQTLGMIFTDYVKDLSGGEHLAIDKWILDKPITLLQMQQELNALFMSYDVRISTLLNYIKLTLNHHNIKLTFCPKHETMPDQKSKEYNEFTLEAIALTQKGSDYDQSASYQ